MGALCLNNKLYNKTNIMNKFKTIKYYLERDIINLSVDQIKKRIKKIIKEQKDNWSSIVKKIKVGKTYAWAINYEYLNLFERQRALSKKYKQIRKKHIINHSPIKKKRDYEFEISINLKNGCTQHETFSYDRSFYIHIVEEIFKITRQDLLYVHEVDKYGYNHVHIALNGEEDDIKIALDYVLVHKLNFDRAYLKSSRAIHFEPLENQHAFRQYLKKIQQFPSFGRIEINTEKYIYKEDNYCEE